VYAFVRGIEREETRTELFTLSSTTFSVRETEDLEKEGGDKNNPDTDNRTVFCIQKDDR
jgi:hypothetical protein